MTNQWRRAGRAATIVLLIVAAVPTATAAGEAISWASIVSRGVSVALSSSFEANDAEEGSIPVDMVRAVGGIDVRSGLDSVTESFKEECLSSVPSRDALVFVEGGIVGFSLEGEPEEVFSDVSWELVEKGWSKVESGSDTQATFVKDVGTYRWLYVSCVGIGEKTSVVVQCV